MKWGAMLTRPDGVPFYLDGTIPIIFLGKITKPFSTSMSAQKVGVELIRGDYNFPTFSFVCLTNVSGEPYGYAAPGNKDSQSIIIGNGEVGVNLIAEVYCFGMKVQSLPKWGVAIFDNEGRCVITNETPVLSDIMKIDNAGIDTQVTLPGKLGVLPENLGYTNGLIHPGGGKPPVAWHVNHMSQAYYVGGVTTIRSTVDAIPVGGAVTDRKSVGKSIYYIDVSKYD